jgi:translation initiation factor 5B
MVIILIRQPIIVVMGHVDHGKCISGDTLLGLGDGRILSAESAFEQFKSGPPIPQQDGVVYGALGLNLLSVDGDKTLQREVTYVWKLKANRLVHVATKAGYEIKTTPEHKFLTITKEGRISYVDADKLKLGDLLIIPPKTIISPLELNETEAQIPRELPANFLLKTSNSLNAKVAQILLSLSPEAKALPLASTLSSYRTVPVTGIKALEGEFTVYDFTVEDTHNFIANGLIVHNTTLLDRIRSTTITAKEAGGITQHIGASEVPIDIINKVCGTTLKATGSKITLPGLLFIDTPGHEAFTNLRKRGGSVADIAILVVDVTKGFEPQTIEAISILKEYKTPFVVAANKIDLITGWINSKSTSLVEALSKQNPQIRAELDNRVYQLVGRLSELGFSSELYSNIKDFKSELAIIPISAKTGEGVADLLMVVTGLAQKFLEEELKIEVKGPGRGSILEKKEVKGLGVTIDVILYDGTLHVNDIIAFATSSGIGTAKIKALLKPKVLTEMREASTKFYSTPEVSAASGVKISGTGLDDALPGSPVIQVTGEDYAKEISAEIGDVFETDKKGVILKTDSIGSIEAISKLMKAEGFGISKKGLGNVTKRDVIDAFTMNAADPSSSVIFAFNVTVDVDAVEAAQSSGIKIIESNIIYKLIDDYKLFVEEKKKNIIGKMESSIIFPGLIKVLPNTCFRVSNPAIFGVEVVTGRIKPGYVLINDVGGVVGKIKELQNDKSPVDVAKRGDEVAISVEGPTFGRQVRENHMLYTKIGDADEKMLSGEFAHLIGDDEKALLKRISEIKKSAKKK